MKKGIFILLSTVLVLAAAAQENMKEVMENRSKEMIRVIGLESKDDYRKFVKANYTEALINKQMRQSLQGPSSANIKTEPMNASDNLEAKVSVYERLHQDIGKGKILSLKNDQEKMDIEVQGESGAVLKIVLTFTKEAPYLIDGFSVQMLMGR